MFQKIKKLTGFYSALFYYKRCKNKLSGERGLRTSPQGTVLINMDKRWTLLDTW